MQSREQVKSEGPERYAYLAQRKRERVNALVLAATHLDGLTWQWKPTRRQLRDMLIAEYESQRYYDARARGDTHQQAMDWSRAGRREVDWMSRRE
jgi:hypothetical protein